MAEFQHIVYTGCGELGIGSWNYSQIIQGNYPVISKMTISKGQMLMHNIPEDIKNDLFKKINDSAYEFQFLDKQKLEEYLNSKTLEIVTRNSILSEFDQSKNRSVQSIDALIKTSQPFEELSTIINNSQLVHLSLTSVGIVLGAMYFGAMTKAKIDISIWIN